MINKSGLILRLAIVVVFAGSAVGFLATQAFYRITYMNEFSLSKEKIAQLYHTVSATASIATYLEDAELIEEVVNGLVSNDIIESVEIKAKTLQIASDSFQITSDTLNFDLFSPFEADRSVGSLSITPNLKYITLRAEQISMDNTLAIGIQAAVITLVVIIVAYFTITSPIITIATRLHNITPGTKDRIALPISHRKSEIGSLVVDVNNLLDRTASHIEQERALRDEVERLGKHFHTLFENSTSPIVLTEPQGDILLYNHAFSQLLKRIGLPLKKNYGPYLKEIFVEQHELERTVQIAFGNEEIASGEFKVINQHSDETIWLQTIITTSTSEDYQEHCQITLHDVSKRRLQLENLDAKASTDELTQILNRRGAENKINDLLKYKTPFALVLVDLNKFKPINDIYGHEAGDEILIHVASQLTKCLRRRDILSRWGGDEFVIVLPNLSRSDVEEVVVKVKEHIETPLYIASQKISLSVGAALGVSFFPEDQRSLKGLIANADKAMYASKELNRTNGDSLVCFYQDLTEKQDL